MKADGCIFQGKLLSQFHLCPPILNGSQYTCNSVGTVKTLKSFGCSECNRVKKVKLLLLKSSPFEAKGSNQEATKVVSLWTNVSVLRIFVVVSL